MRQLLQTPPYGLYLPSIRRLVEVLLTAIEFKDHYTRLHSEQVSRYALLLKEPLGLSSSRAELLQVAALLHDLGKLGIADSILFKAGPLSAEEWKVVRRHPGMGYRLLQQAPLGQEVLEAILHHHERYDGRGYPAGLQGADIPLLARVIAVADAFSALTLDRPYRRALSQEQALAMLEEGGDAHFDPHILRVFISVITRRLRPGHGVVRQDD